MFFIIISASLLSAAVICFFVYRKLVKFDKIAIETMGKILKLTQKEESDSDNNVSVVQYAQISFSTLLKPIVVEKKISKDTFKIGDLIPVFYDQNKPENAILEKRQNGKPILIVALVFLLIAIGVFAYNFKEALIEFKQSPNFTYIGLGLVLLGLISNVFILKKIKQI